MSPKINIQEIAHALDDHGGSEWYLDRNSGEMLYRSLIFSMDEADEFDAALDAEPERYIQIDPLPSRVGFNLMVDFTASLAEGNARRDLERALGGRKPFRAFKDALEAHPAEREQWFKFHDEFMQAEARRWLEEQGIESE
jgi:hypothetical protein